MYLQENMDASEALELILLSGDCSDDLDVFQSDQDDLYIPESDMIEVHEATSSDDESDDNIPLSELAEELGEEASCSNDKGNKKLSKAEQLQKSTSGKNLM